MPKIPVYEQQRLASSVVGTPGVDNSAATLMGNISQGFQQTTNSLLSAAGQQYYADLREQRRLAAEQRAREKATQELLDKSEIANHVYQADSLLGDLETKTKEAGLNDPRAAAGSFDTQAKEALDKYFESQPTMRQEVREGVRVKLLERIKSRQEGMRDWGYTTQVANAAAQVHTNFMDFASRAGKDISPESVMTLFGQIDAYYQEQLPLMGPKIQDDYRSAKEGAMSNYLNAVAQQREDPQAIKDAAALPIFDELPAAKKNSIIGRARELQAQQTRIVQRGTAVNTAFSVVEDIDYLNGKLNEGALTSDEVQTRADAALARGATPEQYNRLLGFKNRIVAQQARQEAKTIAEYNKQVNKSLGEFKLSYEQVMFPGGKNALKFTTADEFSVIDTNKMIDAYGMATYLLKVDGLSPGAKAGLAASKEKLRTLITGMKDNPPTATWWQSVTGPPESLKQRTAEVRRAYGEMTAYNQLEESYYKSVNEFYDKNKRFPTGREADRILRAVVKSRGKK